MIQIQSFTFNLFSENTYLLFDETKECIIIDPGMQSPQEENTVKKFIEEKGLRLVQLLNTHCHIDHVFGNQFIKNTYNLKLQIHKLDVPTLSACKMAAQMYNIHPFAVSEADIFLTEQDTVKFGNSELEILFVPGHAPGHLAFVNKAQEFVIGGDVLFRESIGRTDFPGCNHQDLINSIRTKLFTLGDNYTVYSGHGVTTTIGYEKKYNPFLQ